MWYWIGNNTRVTWNQTSGTRVTWNQTSDLFLLLIQKRRSGDLWKNPQERKRWRRVSGGLLISSNFKLSSRRRESSRERDESREALRQNLSGKRIPNFLFGTSNQIFGFFSFPPPKKCFFYISRWRLPIVSQVSQSLLPTLWGELSLACSVMGPSWGGCYFYLGIFCALPIVTDSDM